ncbi:hypothetical protein Tco_0451371 [Tanacetum coccineum]
MAPLPAADQRHPWLRYQVERYTKGLYLVTELRLETDMSKREGQQCSLSQLGGDYFGSEHLWVRESSGCFSAIAGMSDNRDGSWMFADMLERGQVVKGHFIGSLAMHFGLVNDEGLRGLQVVTRELPLIDLHELGRLNICTRYGDTWAWVAQGPERQQAAAAGAHEADKAGPAANEGAQDIPAPAQAPLPPPPAPQPRTMSQRIERIEEEICYL